MSFLSHPSDYENFKALIPHFKATKGNVGILFKARNGFYHFWKVAQNQEGNFGQMKYIAYRPGYAQLQNAKRPFVYNYVFGDDPALLSPFYKEKIVDTVYYSNTFYLAKLKRPSDEKIILKD